MKMAKASEEEMESAIVLSQVLLSVQDGYYPIDKEEDGESLPIFFDEDDVDHLKRFHELVMKHSGGLHRVTWGFHTLMHNDIVDPDLDHLELHPRIVAALATAEEAKPVPEDQQKKRDYENLTIQALRMRNEIFKGAGMSRKDFDSVYLGGIGDFERDLAKREGIEIKP